MDALILSREERELRDRIKGNTPFIHQVREFVMGEATTITAVPVTEYEKHWFAKLVNMPIGDMSVLKNEWSK